MQKQWRWFSAASQYSRWQRSPKLGFFCGLTARKPYVPQQNSRTKGTSWGCRLAPEMIPITQNCAIWAIPRSQAPHPRQYPFYLFLGRRKPPAQKFSPVYACVHRFTFLILHWFRPKTVEISAGQVAKRPCCIGERKKTRFGTLMWNPSGDFAHFSRASAHRGPSLIFQVSSRLVRVWGSCNQKTPSMTRWPRK